MALGLSAFDPRITAAQPLQGVTEWRNARNGVYVCEVHYTADPAKRTPAWKQQAKQGMPERGWLREMEINWEIPAGLPVFPEYDPSAMRLDVPVNPNARLLRGWDFGHVCPVTLFAQLDMWGRLIFVGELVLSHEGLAQQVESTLAMTIDLMGRPVECFDAGDIAGTKEVDLGSVRRYLMERSILLRAMPSTPASYEAFRQRLAKRVRVPGPHGETISSPACLVTPRCPLLHTALAGAFHYNPKTNAPVDVHPYKDVVDAARYLNDNLLGAQAGFLQKLEAVARADAAW